MLINVPDTNGNDFDDEDNSDKQTLMLHTVQTKHVQFVKLRVSYKRTVSRCLHCLETRGDVNT